MTHRLALVCRCLLVAAVTAAMPLSGAAALDATDEEARQTLMYTALCRGILWPDDTPTQLASDALVADVGLEMATRDLLASAAEQTPALAENLSAEAAAGSHCS